MLIDTGAPINIVNELTYSSLKKKPELDECNNKFYGFGSETQMEVLGQLTSEVS